MIVQFRTGDMRLSCHLYMKRRVPFAGLLDPLYLTSVKRACDPLHRHISRLHIEPPDDDQPEGSMHSQMQTHH